MKRVRLIFTLLLISVAFPLCASADTNASRGSGSEVALLLHDQLLNPIFGDKNEVTPTALKEGKKLFIGTSLMVVSHRHNPNGIKMVEISGGVASHNRRPEGVIEITTRW